VTFRYIIIGAGSAGCVLANRLSDDPHSRVLLLEAGGRDINPFIHMPAGIAQLVHNKRINWDYYTEPERELLGRRLYWPRGKVLGGSSSINAMCYIRGQAQDYDEWASAGNAGWNYDAVLPYFKKSEKQQRFDDGYHGSSGELCVEDLRDRNPLTTMFVEAGRSIGLAYNDDFNGPKQKGIGYYQVTQREGRRCSSAVAYLDPVRHRTNLHVATHSLVTRVIIERGRAAGVEYRRRGVLEIARSDGEVLLSSGSINSPQLLMLSGIGPASHLEAFRIPVVAPLPGVGANLQDHLDVCTLHRSRQPITYDFTLLAQARVALRYWLSRRGPGVSNVAEAGGFLCSRQASEGRPDIQLHFVPAQLDDHGRNRLPGHGYTLHACFLRPRSRGYIRLRSPRADEAPSICANYLEKRTDLDVMVEAARLSREILRASAFDSVRGDEIFPGEAAQTDAEIADFVRRKAETVYHPVGTCRMGVDAAAVVDPQLRVHGVDGLRVVDASVMPTIPSGNTNAPTIMIAEKAAAMILNCSEPLRARQLSECRPQAGAVQV